MWEGKKVCREFFMEEVPPRSKKDRFIGGVGQSI